MDIKVCDKPIFLLCVRRQELRGDKTKLTRQRPKRDEDIIAVYRLPGMTYVMDLLFRFPQMT